MYGLKKLFQKSAKVSQRDAIIPISGTIEGDVISDSSWAEAEITRIRILARQVEDFYGLSSVDSCDDKNIYDHFFKERGTRICPSCHCVFERDLQRAKHCPRCGEYLSVRYGHLLTNKELEDHADRMHVIAVTKIGVPNRINEIRIYERSGASDITKKIIHETLEELSKLIK